MPPHPRFAERRFLCVDLSDIVGTSTFERQAVATCPPPASSSRVHRALLMILSRLKYVLDADRVSREPLTCPGRWVSIILSRQFASWNQAEVTTVDPGSSLAPSKSFFEIRDVFQLILACRKMCSMTLNRVSCDLPQCFHLYVCNPHDWRVAVGMRRWRFDVISCFFFQS